MVMVSSGLNMDGSEGSKTEPSLLKPEHCADLQGRNKAVPKSVPPPGDPPSVLASGWGFTEDTGERSCGAMSCSVMLLCNPLWLSSESFACPAWPGRVCMETGGREELHKSIAVSPLFQPINNEPHLSKLQSKG